MDNDSGPSRLDGNLRVTEEEQGPVPSSQGVYDAIGGNPIGSPIADGARDERSSLRCTKYYQIGTWNVRGMSLGKLEIVKQEMIRTDVDILGTSELHWTGSGQFQSDEFVVYFSGNDNVRRKGVAFIASKRLARCVENHKAYSDRIISIRIRGKPLNITILQVYAPTADASEDEIEQFYSELQSVLNQIPNKDLLYVMGDFNAKVGEGEDARIVGKFGLGKRNDAGDRLMQFCQENRFRIANTWFIQPKRRLYTWTSPNGQHRNQVDFILCQQRWKSSITSTKTLPGADCNTDHQLLVAKMKLKLCKIKKNTTQKKFNVDNISPMYAVEVKNRFDLLSPEGKDPDEQWREIRDTTIEIAEKHVPYQKPKKTNKWLSDNTIKIADQRRVAKARGNRDEAKKLNADFQREARKDKGRQLDEQCQHLEEANKKGHSRAMFAELKVMRSSFSARKGTVRDRDGNELSDQQKIKNRWREYTEELYANQIEHQEDNDNGQMDREPNILEDEIAWAMRQLPNKKAPGIDRIPAELLKSVPVSVITALCQEIWYTCKWPKDWTRSVFIPLPKKGDARDCSNYRTIALISHASKILLKIIQQRLQQVIDQELPDVQAGFRKGRGTRDHIANIRWIIEKTREYQKDLYMCFIDYSKAFDCVEHDKLWVALRDLGVPVHLIKLIRSLYIDQEAMVRTLYGDTDWFRIGKGVRQGCILSPFLFNLYAEVIMRKLNLDSSNIGVKIGGRTINNLRYADDTTLLAERQEDLINLILKIKDESEKMGLHLNIKKTKIMTTAASGEVKIKINDEEIESVQDFIFLGSKIDRDGESTPEIKRRIALGRTAMVGMNKIWKSKDITLNTKNRLLRAIVFPMMMYGCESWSLRKADRRRIDAFEMWCWRKLLRIPWTARVTNREVIDRIKPGTSLEAKITRLRLTYFGHVMRANSLEKSVMLGIVSGTRRRGRQRTRWLDTIKADTNMNINQLKEAVLNRIAWRTLAYKVAESRTRLNG